MMIGRLSPGDSFGEITVLKGLAMPCSVITDTHVQIGTISTLDVYGTFGAERWGGKNEATPPSLQIEQSVFSSMLFSSSWEHLYR